VSAEKLGRPQSAFLIVSFVTCYRDFGNREKGGGREGRKQSRQKMVLLSSPARLSHSLSLPFCPTKQSNRPCASAIKEKKGRRGGKKKRRLMCQLRSEKSKKSQWKKKKKEGRIGEAGESDKRGLE